MTPLALACAAILALHLLAYYVFIAVAVPRYVPGHEVTLLPLSDQPWIEKRSHPRRMSIEGMSVPGLFRENRLGRRNR